MQDIKAIIEQVSSSVSQANTVKDVEDIKIRFLGKKGVISQRMKTLGSLPVDQRKLLGEQLNHSKAVISEILLIRKEAIEKQIIQDRLGEEKTDVGLPCRPEKSGYIHPISQTLEEVIEIFAFLGFSVEDGPEIEDDYHNFSALNIPDNHPARQMQDTFYVADQGEKEARDSLLLRTHTSSVQIRKMIQGKPPFRFIAPGKVYRSDYDATHTPMFHQVEGLYIDKAVHMGHLKGCLYQFLKLFFNLEKIPLRFRNSFFPFTEPSAEVDIGCSRLGNEVIVGEGKDWLEILGCGMVHDAVLHNVGVDTNIYQGFAFGIGIERLAMLKYGMSDLRKFFECDIRWLEHYGFSPYDIASVVRGEM